MAADPADTLTQRAFMAVTAPAKSDRMAFDFAGQIWLRRDASDPATPLTKSGSFNQRPVFSPDGRLVAYESLRSGHRQIFTVNIASGVTRQMTFGQYEHLAPTWSRAASAQPRITMSSNRGGNFDIWEVNVHNLELRQLTFTADDEHDPAWNDDGTHLAYVINTAGNSSLYILTPGSTPQRIIRERDRLSAPAWRPGSRLLTYTRLQGVSHQLRMLLLSSPPITKPITQHEQVAPRPAHWLDRNDFLYTADGKIRRRTFGLPGYMEIPFSVMRRIATDNTTRTGMVSGERDHSPPARQSNPGMSATRSVGKLYNSVPR